MSMLAYYDSFSGLIPCRVVKAWTDRGPSHVSYFEVICTAERGAYKRGEKITTPCLHRIIPRHAVLRRRNCYARILAYDWSREFAKP